MEITGWFRRFQERQEQGAAANIAVVDKLRAVDERTTNVMLSLHVPDGWGECLGCGGHDVGVDWPCRTISALAARHGVA